MKYEYLCIDFETKDPFLDLKMGSGWCYSNRLFKVLGMSVLYPDGATAYITTKAKMRTILRNTRELIVFNANYDIGIVHSLGIDLADYLIIDVLVMSRLRDSTAREHNLNYLSKKLLKDTKSDAALGEVAVELGLVKSKTQSSVGVAKKNMDLIQQHSPKLVAEYAIHDAVLTYKIYQIFEKEGVAGYDKEFYSDLIKALIGARAKGVPIDLLQLMRLQAKFQTLLVDAQIDLNALNGGEPVNVMSPSDVPKLLISHGVNLKTNDKGNYVCDKSTLEGLNHEVSEKILRVRKLRKLKNDFIDKIIDIQEYSIKCKSNDFGSKQLIGYIYPEIHIAGASATGRSSSTGPNIQQIPSRGEEALLIRTVFIPHPGDKAICAADFSAQEPRLIINDAYRIGATGVEKFVHEFNTNPDADFHEIAANLMGIERSGAKTIGLGLLYGMGITKLSHGLGTNIGQAKQLKDRYFDELPFMAELIKSINNSLKKNGYIKTIGGNKLKLDAPTVDDTGKVRTFEYKGLNKRIQGSAAYQTNKALVELYRAGIPFLFPVHDEIVASISSKEDARRIQETMENSYKLCIPSKADAIVGKNWAKCK